MEEWETVLSCRSWTATSLIMILTLSCWVFTPFFCLNVPSAVYEPYLSFTEETPKVKGYIFGCQPDQTRWLTVVQFGCPGQLCNCRAFPHIHIIPSMHSSLSLNVAWHVWGCAYQITPHYTPNMLHISSIIRHVFKHSGLPAHTYIIYAFTNWRQLGGGGWTQHEGWFKKMSLAL